MKTSWQTKKLGGICDFQRGLIYSKKDEVDFSSNIVLRANNIDYLSNIIDFSKLKYISDKIQIPENKKVKKGSLIICTASGSKSHLGKIAFIDDVYDYAFGGFMGQISPRKEVDSKYLFYIFISDAYRALIKNLSSGVNINNLKFSDLENFEIFLPPLSEQHRIVKILDQVFEKTAKAKENAEKNLQNAKELFESYLQSVFANPGKDWEEKKLGDVGKVSMCKRVFKDQTTKTGDIPFYKIGTFGKESNAFISNKIYDEFRRKFSFPKKGDILISASGTIGRRVKYDGKPAYFQDSNIVWIDNDERQVLNDYLYYFYGSCNWNSTKGATISRLYNNNLKQIQIPFPKSLNEQKSIVKKLDALSEQTKKLEANYQQKLADLEELKKSVLKRAFNGEL